MFLRFAPVRCFLVLFLLYGLSPLTSPLPGDDYPENEHLPEFRLFLLDLLGPATRLPGNAAENDPDIPSDSVLVRKKPATVRKMVLRQDVPARADSWQLPGEVRPSLQWAVPFHSSVSSRDLTGAHIRYIGLSPPSASFFSWC